MAASSTSSSIGPDGNTPVPSPTKAFASYVPHLTSALDSLTTHAAALPDKSDLSFHRTLDRQFAKDLDSASDRLLKLTERLLSLVDHSQRSAAEKGKSKAKAGPIKGRRRKLEDEDDIVDGFRQGVVGVVDGLLEDADSCLDDLRGEKKKAAIAVKPALAAAAGQKLPGPFSKPKERLPLSIFHASDIPKPQLLFHDQVDNFPSSGPWRPSMTEKPHAMVPLDFEAPLDFLLTREEEMDPSKEAWRREREIRLRSHPYFYETRNLPYPTSMFIEAPPTPPKSFQDTPFEFVDTPEALEKMVEQLKKAKEIAVDLEHHQMRSYSGFTCLIQISTRGGDYVVDTLKLRKELREGRLGDVMSDPSIIKVFHGADSDIIWLQHDFEIFVVNLFDTYHASVVLDMKERSLASLLSLYCNFEADKRYQMADWRIRPLPEAMLHYARSDTHFLLFIYDNLRNSLLQQSSRPPSPDANGNAIIELGRRNPQQAMRDVLNRSADTALKMYERDEYDEETGRGTGGWLQAARKWLPKDAIDEESGWVFKKLHVWRDRLARQLDESPFYIMPQDLLKRLALLQGSSPVTIKREISNKRSRIPVSPIVEKRADELVQIIKEAKEEFAKSGSSKQVVDSSSVQVQDIVPKPSTAPKAVAITPVVQVAAGQSAAVPDVWGSVSSPVQKTAKPSAKSGLFGSTIKPSAPASSASSLSSSKTAKASTSGLFGSALPNKAGAQKTVSTPVKSKARAMSPGFAAVQQTIHGALEPKPVPQTPGQDVDIVKAIQPEQVPFVPAASRKTASASDPASSSANKKDTSEGVGSDAGASTAKAAESTAASTKQSTTLSEDGVVQVKKVRKQKKRDRVGSTSTPNDASASGTGLSSGKKLKLSPPAEEPNGATFPAAGVGAGRVKAKKGKKKIKVEDVPAFDYANEPNFLDQPSAAAVQGESSGKGKKDKKKKKPQAGIGALEIPTFGKRPARDMSQPKAGNKSQTFAS
ncbi:hypothetical protein I316_04973 [Kwoniella heveanensis BCC8398]|uniref:HRDC domain-containing protein n=1 Tax=Kwoniella heveanensis BCC8398 TaxID=1296120 RepID=A0A1B9GQ97_9TREE|nr:hypothetical protein I316_04973 [Kwoniella heveanensis BCC8398]